MFMPEEHAQCLFPIVTELLFGHADVLFQFDVGYIFGRRPHEQGTIIQWFQFTVWWWYKVRTHRLIIFAYANFFCINEKRKPKIRFWKISNESNLENCWNIMLARVFVYVSFRQWHCVQSLNFGSICERKINTKYKDLLYPHHKNSKSPTYFRFISLWTAIDGDNITIAAALFFVWPTKKEQKWKRMQKNRRLETKRPDQCAMAKKCFDRKNQNVSVGCRNTQNICIQRYTRPYTHRREGEQENNKIHSLRHRDTEKNGERESGKRMRA